jgi:hypothetical protein
VREERYAAVGGIVLDNRYLNFVTRLDVDHRRTDEIRRRRMNVRVSHRSADREGDRDGRKRNPEM